jgi:tRNA wybutosine-synthesizing protein 2
MDIHLLLNSTEEQENEKVEEKEELVVCVVAPFDSLAAIRQRLRDNEIVPLRKFRDAPFREDDEPILMRTSIRVGDEWPRDKILSNADSHDLLSSKGFEFEDPLKLVLKSTKILNVRERSRVPTSIRSGAQSWLDRQPKTLFEGIEDDVDAYCDLLPLRHSKYSNLLILPQYTFEPSIWQDLLKRLEKTAQLELYGEIAKAMKVTHIAINAPIPAEVAAGGTRSKNVLRSPSNIVPLYGSFGLLDVTDPTVEELDSGYWVNYTQHEITQFWCPLYTMFSRGNITEKLRLLKSPTLEPPAMDPEKSSAVDLYAGIGYFTFCYLKRGFKNVLCWDLNPWSLYGMKRGAFRNRWDIRIIRPKKGDQLPDGLPIEQILAFEEDNEHALERIQKLRQRVPPIRHVNCGLLPSSLKSWRTSIRALDPELGGWIHAHETIDPDTARNRGKEMVKVIEAYAETEAHEYGRSPRKVECRKENYVKSFAPRREHFVFDIWASGMGAK